MVAPAFPLPFTSPIRHKLAQDLTLAGEQLINLPDNPAGISWNIAAICRAIAALGKFNFGWTVTDGFYADRHTQHSWLHTKTEDGSGFILDLAPPLAIGGPLLLPEKAAPYPTLYRPGAYDSVTLGFFENQKLAILDQVPRKRFRHTAHA